jgi:thiol:disulfide interchange protein DsbD
MRGQPFRKRFASLPQALFRRRKAGTGRASVLTQVCGFLVAALTILAVFSVRAGYAEDPPRPDEVFRLTASSEAGQIRLHWDIAEGFYLYRSKIHIEFPQVDGLHFSPPVLPDGENKSDDYLGMIQVYHHRLDVYLPFSGMGGQLDTVPATVTYQGCGEHGVCYPPQTRTLQIHLAADSPPLPKNASGHNAPADASEPNGVLRILTGGNTFWIATVFMGLGLLLAFTPCVLPMLPILSSLIVGSGERTGPWKGLGLSAAYVFSMAAAYSVLGLAAGRFGQNLQFWMQSPWIIGAFSTLFILFGLAMFGLFDIQISTSLQTRLIKVVNRLPNGRFISAAGMGFLSALIVGPCVTPPLAGALLYIGQTGDMLTGSIALFALGLGMGIPLLVVGVLGGSILPRAGKWMDSIRAAFGFILFGVAIWMLSRIVPESATVGLWGALTLLVGVFLGFSKSRQKASSVLRLRRCAAVLAAAYGMLLLAGSAAGTHSVLTPFDFFRQRSADSGTGIPAPVFRPLQSFDQLQMVLAAEKGRPVVIDFYADWCVSCKQMERNVFADPRVLAELQQAVLFRPDVTENNEQDRRFMQDLEVAGPPTILFYGPDGRERRDLRLVGEADADAVLDHLHQAMGNGR